MSLQAVRVRISIDSIRNSNRVAIIIIISIKTIINIIFVTVTVTYLLCPQPVLLQNSDLCDIDTEKQTSPKVSKPSIVIKSFIALLSLTDEANQLLQNLGGYELQDIMEDLKKMCWSEKLSILSPVYT